MKVIKWLLDSSRYQNILWLFFITFIEVLLLKWTGVNVVGILISAIYLAVSIGISVEAVKPGPVDWNCIIADVVGAGLALAFILSVLI